MTHLPTCRPGISEASLGPVGFKTRTSCRGLVVLVNQAAEAVPAADAVGGRHSARVGPVVDHTRRAKRKTSVRPLVVVVPHLLAEDPRKVASTPEQQPVQAILPDRPHQRSATALAFGAWMGVVMISVPSDLATSSKARGNLLSRSRMSNRGAVVSSGRSIDSSLARWTTQGPLGWSVTPASRTRRVPSSMKNKP